MAHLLVFGPGYTASHIVNAVQEREFAVETIDRATIADEARVAAAIGRATHILSSVPPDGDADPVLARHGPAIARSGVRWIGYLSSSGVYGDTGGAWVDEAAPVGAGRRTARVAADLAWQALHPQVRVFRLPGIYGPGRSTGCAADRRIASTCLDRCSAASMSTTSSAGCWRASIAARRACSTSPTTGRRARTR
jgi:hypothetical protein